MTQSMKKHLGPNEIAALSSSYIDVGVKQDAWEILEVDVDDAKLEARARMTSYFVSPTDPGGFHLSIFSAQEILGQLANILLHLLAGYETKTRESWMRECSITYRQVIRDPENIHVDMEIVSQKNLGDALAGIVNCRVHDDQGGLFTARLKGLLR